MKKTLFALATAATLAIGFSASAKADPSFGFGFSSGGMGAPGFSLAVTDGYAPGYDTVRYGDGYGYGYRHRWHHRPACGWVWGGFHHHRRVWVCR